MRSLVLVLSLLCITSSFAQEQRYRLERIVIEGPIEAEDIVRAEARLEEERMYGAEDFRQAVYRVRRLPFVADATWRLESGVTSGSTTLVIQILATKTFFYDVDARANRPSNGDTELSAEALLGARKLLGELGTIEGVIGQRDEEDGLTAAVTYRAYDLLGRGAFATVNVGYRYATEARRYDPSLNVLLGWPLSRTQTLTGEVSRRKSRLLRDFAINTNEDDNLTLTDRDALESTALRWWYESSDDPLFARRGTSLNVGPVWSRTTTITQTYDAATKKIVGEEEWTERYGLSANLSAYRPFSARNAGFLRVRGDATTADDIRFFDAAALVGIAHDFHTPADDRLHDFRARFELSYGYRASMQREDGVEIFRDDAPMAEAAFVMRHRWGTMRLTASYSAE
jgi:outer membrane protein assembly factor BamA